MKMTKSTITEALNVLWNYSKARRVYINCLVAEKYKLAGKIQEKYNLTNDSDTSITEFLMSGITKGR